MHKTLWQLAAAAFVAFCVFLIIWGHLSWLPALAIALCAGAAEFARPYAWAWLRSMKAKVLG
jgi:hypothetical protein